MDDRFDPSDYYGALTNYLQETEFAVKIDNNAVVEILAGINQQGRSYFIQQEEYRKRRAVEILEAYRDQEEYRKRCAVEKLEAYRDQEEYRKRCAVEMLEAYRDDDIFQRLIKKLFGISRLDQGLQHVFFDNRHVQKAMERAIALCFLAGYDEKESDNFLRKEMALPSFHLRDRKHVVWYYYLKNRKTAPLNELSRMGLWYSASSIIEGKDPADAVKANDPVVKSVEDSLLAKRTAVNTDKQNPIEPRSSVKEQTGEESLKQIESSLNPKNTASNKDEPNRFHSLESYTKVCSKMVGELTDEESLVQLLKDEKFKEMQGSYRASTYRYYVKTLEAVSKELGLDKKPLIDLLDVVSLPSALDALDPGTAAAVLYQQAPKQDNVRRMINILTPIHQAGRNEEVRITPVSREAFLIAELLHVIAFSKEEDTCVDHFNQLNDVLNDCGFPPLYPRNPFDYMIISCLDPMLSVFETDIIAEQADDPKQCRPSSFQSAATAREDNLPSLTTPRERIEFTISRLQDIFEKVIDLEQ